MQEQATLHDLIQIGYSVWVVCLRCGSSHLREGYGLANMGYSPEATLEEISAQMSCHRCPSKKVRFVPTPRSVASTD